MSTYVKEKATQPSGSPERVEANSYEMRAILYTTMLQMEIDNIKAKSEKRIRSIPGGWRDICLIQSKARSLLKSIYETMTQHQLLQLRRMIRENELRLQRAQTVQTKNSESVTVSLTDLNYLVALAIDSQCGMCIKDRAEQKGCDLRKRLMGICPPKELPQGSICPYMEAVLDCTSDDYFGNKVE